jgi:ribosomal protein S18 acetylase RimI-like enzyme
MTIREPTLADADALGEIHVKAWQAAYRGGLMPDSYLDALSIEERAQMWREALARHPRPEVIRLAVEDDGQLVGFTIVGPCEDEEAKGLGQVYLLNVHPRAWGRGMGRALLWAGKDALKRAGFTEAVLWVHPHNE